MLLVKGFIIVSQIGLNCVFKRKQHRKKSIKGFKFRTQIYVCLNLERIFC